MVFLSLGLGNLVMYERKKYELRVHSEIVKIDDALEEQVCLRQRSSQYNNVTKFYNLLKRPANVAMPSDEFWSGQCTYLPLTQ